VATSEIAHVKRSQRRRRRRRSEWRRDESADDRPGLRHGRRARARGSIPSVDRLDHASRISYPRNFSIGRSKSHVTSPVASDAFECDLGRTGPFEQDPVAWAAHHRLLPTSRTRRLVGGMQDSLLMSGIVVGEDGIGRCAWGASTPEYQAYHDEEWGRPVGDDNRVFEKLCLEGFQSGLSWLTILRKREGFREAFGRFDPIVVARFGDGDINRLLADTGIVRHRGKIVATITNAQATVRLLDQHISLAALVWEHEPRASRPPRSVDDLPASTPESKTLSAELRKRGFRFVGPTTVYAAMQSLGVVNDHLPGCEFRSLAEAERAQFSVPK
jgi:DNA-3-methyladenine glycosylase I